MGAALGGSLLAIRRFSGGPKPRVAIAAAVCWGLLLVAAQDYIGHWHRLRQFDAEVAHGHPLAMAVARDMRPTLAGDVSAQIRARPVWWTLDVVLTAAAAGLVTAVGTRKEGLASEPADSAQASPEECRAANRSGAEQ